MTRSASACVTLLLTAISTMIAPYARSADLTGAWASSPEACSQLFTIKANKASFRTTSELAGSGFIIDGQRIRGRTANCRISRKHESEGIVHIVASCATDVMLSSVPFTLKVVDESTIVRLYPGMPDMEITYHRCTGAAD